LGAPGVTAIRIVEKSFGGCIEMETFARASKRVVCTASKNAGRVGPRDKSTTKSRRLDVKHIALRIIAVVLTVFSGH
jgi:hypothetical protein